MDLNGHDGRRPTAFRTSRKLRTSRLQIPRHPLAAEEPVQMALSSKEKAKRKGAVGPINSAAEYHALWQDNGNLRSGLLLAM